MGGRPDSTLAECTAIHASGLTSALAPLEFTRLIVACAIGYALFEEVPDLWTLAGATIAISTTVYTVRGNAG